MTAERRARRLVALYPKRWRSRYGEEFVELLIADIHERPRSVSRTVDLIRGGLLARAAEAGLAGDALAERTALNASLAAFGCAVAAFLAFGVGLWSQLTIGWQWSAPDAPVIAVALPVMSVALAVLIALGALALMPIVWSAVRGVVKDRRAQLIGPALLTIAGAVVLIAGADQIAHGWPGTGGRPWGDRGLVPHGVAAFGWAATLSITSYWAHPHALGTFPSTQIVWMALGPIAIVCLLAGTVRIVRRVELSDRVLRHEARLGSAAVVAMLAFLGGALAWILAANPGPRGLFRYGAIDLVDVVVMAGAAIAARHLAHRLGAARP